MTLVRTPLHLLIHANIHLVNHDARTPRDTVQELHVISVTLLVGARHLSYLRLPYTAVSSVYTWYGTEWKTKRHPLRADERSQTSDFHQV